MISNIPNYVTTAASTAAGFAKTQSSRLQPLFNQAVQSPSLIGRNIVVLAATAGIALIVALAMLAFKRTQKPTQTAPQLQKPKTDMILIDTNQYRNGNPAACTGLALNIIEECVKNGPANAAQSFKQVLEKCQNRGNQFLDLEALLARSSEVKAPDFFCLKDQVLLDTIELRNPHIRDEAATLFNLKNLDAALITCNGITIGAYNTKTDGWIFFDSHGIENQGGLSSRGADGEMRAYVMHCRTQESFIRYLHERFLEVEDGGDLINTMNIYPLIKGS